MWRGGTGLAEKVAAGLQKVPMVVSAALICAVPLSCGAVSLVAGAAFYAFMLSKMYEEYLEDFLYKLVSKVASRVCRIFKSKQSRDIKPSVTERSSSIDTASLDNNDTSISDKLSDNIDDTNALIPRDAEKKTKCNESETNHVDDDLNNINFHMIMFFLWMAVTVVNIPALLTWARNFKYSMVLKPDTSYHTGFIMSSCSVIIWQLNGPRKNLRNYEGVASLLFTMAVFMLALGPFSLSIVNYGVTFMFTIITIQQLYDADDSEDEVLEKPSMAIDKNFTQESEPSKSKLEDEINKCNFESNTENKSTEKEDVNVEKDSECDVCNESRIYNIFKNLRDKFSFSDDNLEN